MIDLNPGCPLTTIICTHFSGELRTNETVKSTQPFYVCGFVNFYLHSLKPRATPLPTIHFSSSWSSSLVVYNFKLVQHSQASEDFNTSSTCWVIFFPIIHRTLTWTTRSLKFNVCSLFSACTCTDMAGLGPSGWGASVFNHSLIWSNSAVYTEHSPEKSQGAHKA